MRPTLFLEEKIKQITTAHNDEIGHLRERLRELAEEQDGDRIRLVDFARRCRQLEEAARDSEIGTFRAGLVSIIENLKELKNSIDTPPDLG